MTLGEKMEKKQNLDLDLTNIDFKITSPYISLDNKLLFLKNFVNKDLNLIFNEKTQEIEIGFSEDIKNAKDFKNDIDNKLLNCLLNCLSSKTNTITLGNVSFYGMNKNEAQLKLWDYVDNINMLFNLFVKSNKSILNDLKEKIENGHLNYEIVFLNSILNKNIKTETECQNLEQNTKEKQKIKELSHPDLFNIHKEWKIGQHTLDYVKKMEKSVSGINAFDVGLGKAQPLDSLILTDNGWVKMGDIKVGQEIFAYDGTLTKVTGVFPSGYRKNYRVHFNDKTYEDCCDEHLWFTQTLTELKESCEKNIKDYTVRTLLSGSVKPLKDIHNTMEEQHIIPTVCPIQFSKKVFYGEKEKNIHPYLIGVYLANGNHLDLLDYEVEDVIQRKLNLSLFDEEEKLKNIFSIPNEYLISSIEDRLFLLQGFLDVKGYVNINKKNLVLHCQDNVAFDLCQLIMGLGGTCFLFQNGEMIQSLPKQKTNLAFAGNEIMMIIKFPTLFKMQPFLTKTKIKRWKNCSHIRTLKSIVRIEYLGEKECQCIKIDHPSHLYVTSNFIVTHNTSTSLIMAQNLQNKEIKKKLFL